MGSGSGANSACRLEGPKILTLVWCASLEGGHLSLVVKFMDSWLACHEFERSTSEDSLCRGNRCTLKASRLKRPPVVEVWKLREGSSSGIVLVT
ncbi:hypothetical protein TNCV_3054271 [Trichonephila clavipes]|nr:hypothetical protein TNCV_3054271 [Trichonephila clavipes]